MTKWNKRIVKTVVALIASLFIFAGGVLAGTLYLNWDGSTDFNISMNTMDKTKLGIEMLNSKNESLTNDNESLTNDNNILITEKEKLEEDLKDEKQKSVDDLANLKESYRNQINTVINHVNKNENGKGNRYDYLREQINNASIALNDGVATGPPQINENPGKDNSQKELEQAIIDMRNVEGKSSEVFDSLPNDIKSELKEHKDTEYKTSVQPTEQTIP